MADQGTEGLLSPFLRRVRLAAAKPHLRGRVLDIGCGSGALAALVGSDNYIGIDIDELSLARARTDYPNHTFQQAMPASDSRFDTVVSLAVIEHVEDPGAFLSSLKGYLAGPDSRLVITTPHPTFEWLLEFGASIGLFSQHAEEEHEDLLDRSALYKLAESTELTVAQYVPFLFRANQLCVYQRAAAERA